MYNIDLHLHLDGSMKSSTICELHRIKYGLDLPKDALISIENGKPTLTEYLEYFKYPIMLMKNDLEAIQRVAYEMVEQLNANNINYAEIRYAPQLLTEYHNITAYVEIMRAVQDGFKQGMVKFPNVEVKTIICLMRGISYKINRDTFEAAKYLSKNEIVAFDLAGDEIHFLGEEYKDIFQDAKLNGYNLTIHAGEGRGPESIKMALDFGADRIGHGLSLHLDNKLLSEMAERKICVESCPISNFQTGAVLRYGYEIKKYLQYGVPVCINTDNMTVSNTNLFKEFDYLKTNYLFNKNEIEQMKNNAYKYAFKKEWK